MTVLAWEEMLRSSFPCASPVNLTIGVFDGLHRGHQRLLAEVTSGEPPGVPVVVTFLRSPASIMRPETWPGSVLTHRQKLERMASRGIEGVVVIDFSNEMSNLSGEAFVRLLRENLTIQKIVVGQNFRFGKKRASGTDDLRDMLSGTGIQLVETAAVLQGGGTVSSSRVRAAIACGDLDQALDLLGSPHTVDVRDVPVHDDGGPAGHVRYSRADIEQVLPPAGEYAVTWEGAAGSARGTCRVQGDWLTLQAAPVATEHRAAAITFA